MKNYLLAVLTVNLVFDKVEHAALGVLLQSIKRDLELTDTQLGLLTGIAFTLFYSVMGIPISRWADRGNRVAMIDFLVTEKHLPRDEAYALTSVAVDVDITQLVDGKVGVHAICPKAIFTK